MDILTMYGALPGESQEDFLDFGKATTSTIATHLVVNPGDTTSFQFIAVPTFTGSVIGAGLVNLTIYNNPYWDLIRQPNCQMWIPANVLGTAGWYSYIPYTNLASGYIHTSLDLASKNQTTSSPVGCTISSTDADNNIMQIDIFDLPAKKI
jgi:hypothetical protein